MSLKSLSPQKSVSPSLMKSSISIWPKTCPVHVSEFRRQDFYFLGSQDYSETGTPHRFDFKITNVVFIEWVPLDTYNQLGDAESESQILSPEQPFWEID